MSPRISQHKAPFPWFGGKAAIADEVWHRFGDVGRYVEPFAGSLAVLLNRPRPFSGREIVNDADGLLVNAWRAMAHDPEGVAHWADWPLFESDLHARHAWLVGQRERLTERLEGDPDWFDPKAAGWWLWGIGLWIGGGWCSGDGPWRVTTDEDGTRQLLHAGNDGQGVHRKLLHAGDDGQGVRRQRLHAGNDGQGVRRQRLHAGDDGRGVHRKLLHAGDDGRGMASPEGGSEGTTARASVTRKRLPTTGNSPAHGIHSAGVSKRSPAEYATRPRGVQAASRRDSLAATFADIADRMRDVMVMAGDWSRVVTPAVLSGGGSSKPTAVFLDPPYADTAGRSKDLYAKDSESVAHAVREWAVANGDDPRLRIALCGYEGEHEMPASWSVLPWKAHGGYGGQGKQSGVNARRERVWFSPACHAPGLWDEVPS